jgi:hypothetical protein
MRFCFALCILIITESCSANDDDWLREKLATVEGDTMSYSDFQSVRLEYCPLPEYGGFTCGTFYDFHGILPVELDNLLLK